MSAPVQNKESCLQKQTAHVTDSPPQKCDSRTALNRSTRMPFATANFGAIPFRCGNTLRRLDTARTLVMRASILGDSELVYLLSSYELL